MKIYIVQDKKAKTILGIFDDNGVKEFMEYSTLLIGDKFFEDLR